MNNLHLKIGELVKLKTGFFDETDRHNPTDVLGKVVLIGNPKDDYRRTKDLPIVVDWGGFTNSYGYRMLDKI